LQRRENFALLSVNFCCVNKSLQIHLLTAATLLLLGNSMSKTVVLMLLALLALSSLVMVGSVLGQSIPKPSVPEFAVELIDSSYDVPTTYTVDPFTGENVTHEGYHVESRTMEVKIENQPFTPYEIKDSAGNSWIINFCYNIRIKGHFSEDWIELYRPSDGYPYQLSDLDYTVFSYVWGGDADTVLGTKMIRIPAGAEVDFQVEAMIGYVHRDESISVWAPWVFEGELSGWSNTQTITIESQTPLPEPTTPTSPSPLPSDEPQQADQDMTAGAIFTVLTIAVFLGLLVYFIKRG